MTLSLVPILSITDVRRVSALNILIRDNAQEILHGDGTFWRGYRLCFWGNCTEGFLSTQLDILKGNHLMVPKTLEVMGALHGYGIARHRAG